MRFIYHKVCRHFIVGIHYARVTTSEVSNSPRTGVPSWWIHQWPWLGVCCILKVVAGPGKNYRTGSSPWPQFYCERPSIIFTGPCIILSEASITNSLFLLLG